MQLNHGRKLKEKVHSQGYGRTYSPAVAAKPEPKVAANQTVHVPPAALTPQAHTKPMGFPRSSLADAGSPLATQTPEALALKAKVGWCGTVCTCMHAMST